jgi:ATP-dependent DNA helicase RecQ
VEAYLQESGRAGRDGKLSKAYLLWGPADKRELGRAKDERAARRIGDLLNYAGDTGTCRREKLLALLDYQGSGDKPPENCCDVCEGRARAKLREEETLIRFFRKNPRSYTPEEAAEILGAAEQIRWSAGEAKIVLRELINQGKLRVRKGFPWKGRISLPFPFSKLRQ